MWVESSVAQYNATITKTLHKKATINQVTAMLATSKIVLCPGHNHQYWWLNTLIIARVPAVVMTWKLDIFKSG